MKRWYTILLLVVMASLCMAAKFVRVGNSYINIGGFTVDAQYVPPPPTSEGAEYLWLLDNSALTNSGTLAGSYDAVNVGASLVDTEYVSGSHIMCGLQYINASTETNIGNGSTAITYNVFFQVHRHPSGSSTFNGVLLSRSNEVNGISLGDDDGEVQCRVETDVSGDIAITTTNYTLYEWCMATLTWDAGSDLQRQYINGVLVGEVTNAGNVVNVDNTFRIGRDDYCDSQNDR